MLLKYLTNNFKRIIIIDTTQGVATMYTDESYTRLWGKLYKRILLKEPYRDDGKVEKRTVGNLSHCSEQEIAAIKFGLAHKDNIKDMVSEKELA